MDDDVPVSQGSASQYQRKAHCSPIRERNVNFPLAARKHHRCANDNARFRLAARVGDIAFGENWKLAHPLGRAGHIRATKPHPFDIILVENSDVIGMKCCRLGPCVDFHRKIIQAKFWQADAFMPTNYAKRL